MEKKPTRYYSDLQENYIKDNFKGQKNSNSGAGQFRKGDVLLPYCSTLVECKTCTEGKQSFSIKKEWLDKNKEEAFAMRCENSCICFNFGPNQKNYFVIDEKLMHFLVDKLEEEYNEN